MVAKLFWAVEKMANQTAVGTSINIEQNLWSTTRALIKSLNNNNNYDNNSNNNNNEK